MRRGSYIFKKKLGFENHLLTYYTTIFKRPCLNIYIFVIIIYHQYELLQKMRHKYRRHNLLVINLLYYYILNLMDQVIGNI